MIEMLISLGIFAIVTGFVMANFRTGSQSDELRISAQLVANGIRRVQTSAMAGQTVKFCRDSSTGADGLICSNGGDADCPAGSSCVNDVPSGGYGIHFEATEEGKHTMVSFIDTDGDRLFDPQEEYRREGVSPDIFVSVSGLTPSAPGPALDIVFVPPKPSVFFNAASDEAQAVITLQHRSTLNTKDVTINAVSGQVSAD